MEFKVETRIIPQNLIVQSVCNDVLPIPTQIMNYVIDLQESQIIQSLIKLGWTPPKGIIVDESKHE